MRSVIGVVVLTLGLFASVARAQTTEEEAGDVSELDRDKGPLRERIAPVSGQLLRKRGRFEISPSATVSLADPFFTKYIFGGTFTFHMAESFALGLRGGYSLPTISTAAQICTTESTGSGTTRGCRLPNYNEVNGRAPGQITLVGGLDLQWAPIYGKISLLAERFLHFDLYAVGGAAMVQYVGPTPAGVGPQFTVGANAGGGMRFFINRWMTVRAELRDLIYVENVPPLPATSLRNQLLFEIGLSLFFPTPPGES